MSHAAAHFSEQDRTQLRRVIDAIERELSCLGREATAEDHRSSMSSLVTSWAEMLSLLSRGSPPETRACPGCGHLGPRAAARCAHCWAELPPRAPTAAAG